LILLYILVALPGLEPGLFALRGRRVNQLHHNAMNGSGIRCDLLIIANIELRSEALQRSVVDGHLAAGAKY
jgi:hypothetical protein